MHFEMLWYEGASLFVERLTAEIIRKMSEKNFLKKLIFTSSRSVKFGIVVISIPVTLRF